VIVAVGHAADVVNAERFASEVASTPTQAGRILRLEVISHGPPIPLHQRRLLFEPFSHGDHSRHSLGLGLFIAREIVRGHGGTIDVRSDADETAFVVRLPRR